MIFFPNLIMNLYQMLKTNNLDAILTVLLLKQNDFNFHRLSIFEVEYALNTNIVHNLVSVPV